MSKYSIDKKRIAFENIFRQLNLFKVTNKLRKRHMYYDYVCYKMLHNIHDIYYNRIYRYITEIQDIYYIRVKIYTYLWCKYCP